MKIFLTKEQFTSLLETGDLLQKSQIIQMYKKSSGIDISEGLRIRYCDYRDNPLAPEKFAYRLSWISVFSGKREQGTYWPFSVGMQA